jgi:two-component system sensor histidine kinase KdpD
MASPEHNRPNPDTLLHALKKEEQQATKAKLKIFFGMCAGVGKTYDMLKDAQAAKSKGIDVVIGYIETHKRAETEALVAGMEIIPRKKVEYKGTALEEMDLDAILTRKPQLVLVDELAHTNVPGSRHTKRYQDVQELLDNGIDVHTTLNIQHLESRADTVAQITGSIVRETVPDSIFEQADEVEIIDIPPDELLRRLSEGKVYTPERSKQAIENFFRKGNLTALREMSLRLTAERVDHQLRDYMQTQQISGTWKSGQRLLVAISVSPHSVSLIRWARRVAYSTDASWIAVFVERAAPLSDAAKSQLEKNIKLARELGAEIVSTAEEDVAQALVRVARQQNATQIIVGKPQRSISFKKNLLDRVIEKSGDLDVYVVGGSEEPDVRSQRFHLPEIQSGVQQYLAAVAAVTLVALLCYPLASLLGYQTVSLILLLTVALLPLKLGAGPVVMAAALSALLWDFFFIPPQFTFVVARGQDILMLVTYFTIAAVTGTLTARIRAREKAVLQREERATALYTLTKDLSTAGNQEDVARAAISNIKKFFEAEVAVFLSEPDGDIFTRAHSASTFAVDEKEFSVAAWVYWNEKRAGKFTDTLPFAHATYYPMSGPRYPLGVIGVKLNRVQQLSFDQETLLQNFISQIASTLEREQLNEMTKKSIAIVESERLYKTLFNSISHELRTPIAAIISASDGLLDEKSLDRKDVQKNLTHEIHTAAERLNRLVENLLDMTRLESGRITPRFDWCDLHDLINTMVRKLTKELSHHIVAVGVPTSMPLVKIDYGLIEQALTNLLHNASLYTPAGSKIEIRASIENHDMVIIIADNGPGFSKDVLPRVFEKFYRVPGTKAGGTGLGLSIVRGFVEVHKGTIVVQNRPEGGAQFVIRIPTEIQDNQERLLEGS